MSMMQKVTSAMIEARLELCQLALSLTYAADPQNVCCVVHRGERAGFSMAAAIELRSDFSGDDLPQLRDDLLGLVLSLRHSWHPSKA
jgi:hypothetical protein